MATVQKFEDLTIWKKARELENKISALVTQERFKNDFDLIRQMRRSCGKIMDNIAEGFGRNSNYEFVQFLSIATGSASELQSQLYRSKDRVYITGEEMLTHYGLAEEVIKMGGALSAYLNKSEIKGLKFKDRNKTK